MTNTINLIEVQIKEFVDSIRPSVEIRDKVNIGYRFEKNTMELFEIRPRLDKQDEKVELPFAKARFYKSQSIWKLYWMRANGRWEFYETGVDVTSIDTVFTIIKEDKHGCFSG